MTANEIRRAYLDFFAEQGHKIVPSSPIVNKNDPTLLFTNAGMNQFKDFFLGNKTPDSRRVADTQKCMRVSGKHNDLEDVGRDGTHHTMFEMLGNWSFGDYFKEEAITWSWKLLTERLGIDPELIYATVFEGAPEEGVPRDDEAKQVWLKFLPEERILLGNKKDNFWEMGETGPCGPCTEIHVDTRTHEERLKVNGRDLVNIDDSGVVEIWNNVFIQFNRLADGSLENLPERHVDTGMGFERLCMILQGKQATYDTDIFTPILRQIEELSGHKYGGSYAPEAKTDMAMRVVADHLRAVAFTIADGQLPSNTGAGYVVRRILRRAVRYYFSFLEVKSPFLFKLIPTLVNEMGAAFPELAQQKDQIAKIIEGEEKSFLQTLDRGLGHLYNGRFLSIERALEEHLKGLGLGVSKEKLIDANSNLQIISFKNEFDSDVIEFEIGRPISQELATYDEVPTSSKSTRKIFRINPKNPGIHIAHWTRRMEEKFSMLDFFENLTFDGDISFELYDTFGFPFDLVKLILEEEGWKIDEAGFETALKAQKDRSKADAAKSVGDWISVGEDIESVFIGYDQLEADDARITKYRTVELKGKPQYQVVLDRTPFYGESGGQAGDKGTLTVDGEDIPVYDTQKENDLTVHLVKKLPETPDGPVIAKVHASNRQATSQHHTAAHLLHAALHEVLGKHAVQKGQDVGAKRVRFDFSHFERPSAEELQRVEDLVNEKIRQNIPLIERRNVPIAEAKESGAMMLFGEKYGDSVRIITFDPDFSSELCGGTHVPHTGELGLFKIDSESSLAAGIRRIEAVVGEVALAKVNGEMDTLVELRGLLKNSQDVVKSVASLQDENRQLKKELEKLKAAQAGNLKGELLKSVEVINGVNVIATRVDISDAATIKTMVFNLEKELGDAFILIGSENDGKPMLTLSISKELTESKELHAGNIIREIARNIKGGGGGQPFFATAGGKDVGGLDAAIAAGKGKV